MELTTVSTDHAVFHDGTTRVQLDGLAPASRHEHEGIGFSTLPAPGQLLCRFATVNDVHFGETVCGLIEGDDVGPVFRSAPGDSPYPEIMNAGAIEEIRGIDPALVIAKGDLTDSGLPNEYERFKAFYAEAFGERLHHIRGNHDSYHHQHIQCENTRAIDLAGVTVVTLDTTRDGAAGGTLYDDDLDWLDALAAEATQPVLVFGHHHIWDPSRPRPEGEYFGIQPDESIRLVDLVARRPSIRGYFSGHTHRNRVRRFHGTGDVPWVEVGCVKDFPGNWAEYQVYSGGILQIVHRISTPAALDWTEKTRRMFNGTYGDYAAGRLEDRCFVVAHG